MTRMKYAIRIRGREQPGCSAPALFIGNLPAPVEQVALSMVTTTGVCR